MLPNSAVMTVHGDFRDCAIDIENYTRTLEAHVATSHMDPQYSYVVIFSIQYM